MGRKTQNFFRWTAGAPRVTRSEYGGSDVESVKSAKSAKSELKHKPKPKRKSTKAKSRPRRSSYRQTYPDPRPTSKEKYTWSEDWHMGEPFRRRRQMPVLDFYSVRNTPNTHARLVRPASLPRLTHPQAPRDFWRDGLMMTNLPPRTGSDNDSGYGSNDDEDENDNVMFYDPSRDQISPPLRHGRVVVEPNPHFHVEWIYPTKDKKTTMSGYRYQCRVINGYKDGIIRFWAQGAFKEGGRWYMPRHDDYRRKLEKSTFDFNDFK